MKTRKSRNPPPRKLLERTRGWFSFSIPCWCANPASLQSHSKVRLRTSFDFGVCAFALLLLVLSGCGAPGEPTPPSPPVPAVVNDLSARQAGDGVQLTFTMPAKTIKGERLTEPPSVEVLRGALKADGSPDNSSFREVYTVPGALVGKYLSDDHIQFADPVAPEETRAHPGATFVYRVRTRASKKRTSGDSNSVTVRLFPVPQRIPTVHAEVTQTAIELNWTPVRQTSGGDLLPAAPEYHVYRGELDPRTYDSSPKDQSHEKWIAPLAQLAGSEAPDFRDSQFEFGKVYVYMVRSAITVEGNVLESDDSERTVVVAKDIFPPAVPQGLVAAVTSASPSSPLEVDLSWAINSETDLAGYRVYRSERREDKGELVTPDLLLSPAYRDISVQPNRQYWYRVTSVDRAGNESVPSAPVLADVAQHSP
jgi:uncharacterized protein